MFFELHYVTKLELTIDFIGIYNKCKTLYRYLLYSTSLIDQLFLLDISGCVLCDSIEYCGDQVSCTSCVDL